MAFDIKAYRDKNAHWYGEDPLENVARDVYGRGDDELRQGLDYDTWKKESGIQAQIDQEIAEQNQAATQQSAKEHFETRGVMGDIASDVAGGVVDYGELGMRALHGGMRAVGLEDTEAGRAVQSGIEGISSYREKTPFVQENPENDGFFSRSLHGGIRSAVQSITAGLPGAAAGAAIGGAATGPLAPFGAALGAVVGYATSGALQFGLAQYDDVMERGLKAGLSREEVEPAAMRSGLYEGGFEFATDILEGITMGAGKLVTAPGKAAAKVAVKDMLGVSFKELGKRAAKLTAIETSSEMVTAGAQAEEERALGLGDQRFWGAAVDAFGPSVVASMIFAGLGHANTKYAQRKVRKALEDPNTDPNTRAAAADEIYSALQEYSPLVADTWGQTAYAAIKNGQSISTDDNILDLQDRIQAVRQDPSPQAQKEADTLQQELNTLFTKEHKKPLPTSKEDLELERQYAGDLKRIIGDRPEARKSVDERIGQLDQAMQAEEDYEIRREQMNQHAFEMPARRTPYSPELAEQVQPGPKQLPPGQGFEMRGAPEDVYSAYSPELSEQASAGTKRLPPGQGFELRGKPGDVAAPYSPELASAVRKPKTGLPEGQGFELKKDETPQQKIQQLDTRIKNLSVHATQIGRQISKVSSPEKREKLQTRLQELQAQIDQNRARKSILESMLKPEESEPSPMKPADQSAQVIEAEAKRQESALGRDAGRIQSPVGKERLRTKLAEEAEAAKMRSAPKEPLPPRSVREIDEAANMAATSPKNDIPQPTQAQKEAGNYAKGHVNIQGLDISIENPKGSERKGVSPEGKPWSTKMKQHYGYFKGTVGHDKDHVDTFIGDKPESQNVFIVDQVDPKTMKFDEHKVMLGFDDLESARKAYLSNYEKGWQGEGPITSMSMDEFKAWVKDPKKTKRPANSKILAPGAAKPGTPGRVMGRDATVRKSSAQGGMDYELWEDSEGEWVVRAFDNDSKQLIELRRFPQRTQAQAHYLKSIGKSPDSIQKPKREFEDDVAPQEKAVPRGSRTTPTPHMEAGPIASNIPARDRNLLATLTADELSNKLLEAKSTDHRAQALHELFGSEEELSAYDNGKTFPDYGTYARWKMANKYASDIEYAARTEDKTGLRNLFSKVKEEYAKHVQRQAKPRKVSTGSEGFGTQRTRGRETERIHDQPNLSEKPAEAEKHPDLETMVKEASRWRGAAFNADQILKDTGRQKDRLAHMRATGKKALDRYLMKKFGIDETTARDVSNELTARNIKDDRTAKVEDFAGESWADNVLGGKPVKAEKPAEPEKPKSVNDASVDEILAEIRRQVAEREVKKAESKSESKTKSGPTIRENETPEQIRTRAKRLESQKTKKALEGAKTLRDVADKKEATLSPKPTEKLKSAGDHLKAIKDIVGQINDIFGERGSFSTEPLDEPTWQKIRPLLKQAWNHAVEAGQDVKEFVSLVLDSLSTKAAPYFERFIQEEFSNNKKASPHQEIADWVKTMIGSGKVFIGAELFQKADKAFGGTQGEGRYSPKDAYDAMEMGVNQFVMEHPEKFSSDVGIDQARHAVNELREITEKLATQSKRTAEMDEFQQFSTPPPLAYAATWVAKVTDNDTVLEPSAGIGGIASFSKVNGATVIVNELSKRRFGIIGQMGFDRTFNENAEQINNILPNDVRPTVVVMNPPFSATAGRITGQRKTTNAESHIEQALSRLEPGGRLVAIVGRGMSMDASTFKGWWAKIRKQYDVRADIGVSGKEYSKYGTQFDNRILVIDKATPKADRTVVRGEVENALDALPLLEEIRNDRTTAGIRQAEQPSGKPGGKERASAGETAGGLGSGTRAAIDAVGIAGRADQAEKPSSGGVRGAPADVAPRGRDEAPDDGGRRRGDKSVRKREGEPGGAGPGSTGTGPATPDRNREVRVLKPENLTHIPTEREIKEEATRSDSAVYDRYHPTATIPNAQKHPGNLVESSAMASVQPPKVSYRPSLPGDVVTGGKLSDAQLESVIRAGEAHSTVLPDGKRQGFFLGDGTGVGKGRQIAAIILDNWNKGRRKAIWLSANTSLFNDARRDVAGLGDDPDKVFNLGKIKTGAELQNESGILFGTYSLLKQKTGESGRQEYVRMQQIAKWLGADFDGVIVFDEAHKMGNALPIRGKRGTSKPSETAISGIELQNLLPKARVVYVSATGATEVMNLAYATRLGLWGEGTPFANVSAFVNEISSGGIAAMELVARDLKAMGKYLARSLSYHDVTYDRLEHSLTGDQREIYDKLAEGWQTVLQNVLAAIEETKGRRGAATSAFWGAHQRFFNQVVTSLQMPSVIERMHQELSNGNSVVLQLVSTGAAQLDRKLAAMTEDDVLEEMDMTPREQLMQYIERSFPVQQFEEYEDEEGRLRTRPVIDSQGNPVLNAEAVAMRDRLLDELGSIRVPDGPIDMVMNEFGARNVAEVTGRTRRVVIGPDGKREKESRTKARTEVEAKEFMDGKKRILIFSDAGGTGLSYHADLNTKNQEKRVHFLVQPGWRASEAVQGFGRTHRTNQKQAPQYLLVTTDLKGQKRFISSIARRLDQLGALTKGQRQTGSQGFFDARDNLESEYASDALQQLYRRLYQQGEINGVTLEDFQQQTGLRMVDENGNLVLDTPPMPQFLNRLLSMKYDTQNAVFDAFSEQLDRVVEREIANGTLDHGIENLKGDTVDLVNEQTVYTDEKTGAETKYVELDVTNKSRTVSFKESQKHAKEGYYQNLKSERIWGAGKAVTRTRKDGAVVTEHPLSSATGAFQKIHQDDLQNPEKWRRVPAEEAGTLWEQEHTAAPKTVVERKHMITGAVLPIWDRLSGSPKVLRVITEDGKKFLGRLIDPSDLQATLARLGATGSSREYAGKDLAMLLDQGNTLNLANQWRIKPARVSGEVRIELVGPDYTHMRELEKLGVFTERIQYQTRFFIPSGSGRDAAFEGITRNRPVVEVVAPVHRQTGAGDSAEDVALSLGSATQPSRIERLVSDRLMETGNAKTFATLLKSFAKKGDISQQELDRSDALKWLGTKDGRVKKADLLKFLEVNSAGKKQTSERLNAKREEWRAEIERHISRITGSWKGVQVRVVKDLSEVPEKLANRVFAWKDRIHGLYDPASKTAYLLTNNFTTMEEAEAVLLHEVVGHHGMRILLGDRYKPFLNQVTALYGKEGLADIAALYGFDLNTLDGRLRAADEKIARMAEANERPSFLKRLYAAIREVLRDLGFKVQLSDDDIKALLVKAGKNLGRDRSQAIAHEKSFAVASLGRTNASKRIGEFYDEAMANPTNIQSKVSYAEVSPEQAERVKRETGVNTTGFTRIIDNFAVLHILDKHGNAAKEAKRGQIAVTKEDFLALPEITANPDFIVHGGKSKQGGVDTIWSVKKINGYVYYLEEVRTKRRELAAKTLLKAGATARDVPADVLKRIQHPPSESSETLRGLRGNTLLEQDRSQASVRPTPEENKEIASTRTEDTVKNLSTLKEKGKPGEGGDDSGPLLSLSASEALDRLQIQLEGTPKANLNILFGNTKDLRELRDSFRIPAWLAKTNKTVKRFFDRQNDRDKERSSMYHGFLESTRDAFNLDKAGQEELAKLAFGLENRKVVDEPTYEKTGERELKKGQEVVTVPAYQLNPAHYEALDTYLQGEKVGADVRKAYVAVRKTLDQTWLMALDRLMELRDIDPGMIRKFRTEMGRIQNYFPHNRYGNHFLKATDPEAKPGEDTVYRQHFNAMNDRHARFWYAKNIDSIIGDLKKSHPDVEWDRMQWEVGKNQQLPEEVYDFPIPVDAMQQIIDAAVDKMPEEDGMRSALKRELSREISDTLKSRGFGSHMIGRKDIPGHETLDPLRVIHDHFAGFSGWLTKMNAAHDFGNMLRDIDAKRTPNEYKWATKFTNDMLQNASGLDRVVDGMRSFFFVKYLGANLKTALVNLTQNIIAGVPRLSMDTGSVKASKEFLRAANDIKLNITQKGLASGKGRLTDSERAFLVEMFNEGWGQSQLVNEMRGKVGGPFKRQVTKAIQVIGLPMEMAERFNRMSLGLAAFRAAREGAITNAKALRDLKLEPGKTASVETAKRFAENVVNDAHFVYGKGNRPAFLRGTAAGKVLSTSYTFRSFSHNLLSMWRWMLTEGDREGKKAFAYSLMAMVSLGGVGAIPLYNALAALIRQLFGEDILGLGVRKLAPKGMRDIVMYGAPSALGINIGGSVGMDLPIVDRMRINQSLSGQIGTGIGELLGIPYAALEEVTNAVDAVRSGRMDRAAETIAPTFLKNIMSGVRLATEGQTTVSGRPINVPGERGPRKISAGEAIGKGLGFQPLSSSKAFDIHRSLEEVKSYRDQKQEELANRYVAAERAKDNREVVRVQREAREWNRRMVREKRPEMKINLEQAVRARNKARQPMKQMRGLARDYRETFNM